MIRKPIRCRVKRELLIILTTFVSSALVTLQFIAVIEERHGQKGSDVTPYDPQDRTQYLRYRSQIHEFSNDIQPVKFRLSQADYNESDYSDNNVEDKVMSADYESGAQIRTRPVAISMDDDPSLVLNENARYKHFLTIQQSGRLGNLMFSYAALLGISRRNFMIPVVAKDHPLRAYFGVTAAERPSDGSIQWSEFEEEEACSHDFRTEELNYGINIELVGFYQSWKYFRDIPDIIRKEFSFKPSILDVAKSFLYSAARKMHGDQVSFHSVITVGIHLRRGDMLSQESVIRGYTVATIDYIDTAMSYFLAKYNAEKLLFVVCSDEPEYIRSRLSALPVTSHVATVYADLESFQLEMAPFPTLQTITNAEVQLCLLSLCKHSIISTGSFSWWAGWFSNGTVLYYMDFPTPYSPLDDEFLPEDYYPPHWIGIS